MKKKIIITGIVIAIAIGGLFYFDKLPQLQKKSEKVVVPENNGWEIVSTGEIVGSMKSANVEEYLTDTKGRTLYAFGDDKKLESVCYDECLKKWPVFEFDNKNMASSTDLLSRRMNLTKRKDGYYQYVYGNRPVYYYIGDKKPGDMNGISGENIGSKWSLIIIQR